MLVRKNNLKRGFTLVELLVTITIFVILTAVVLFSQSKFNSTILLTNLAYDTALTIRQAQTYGINIKEFGTGNFAPYGVHFDLTSPKSFILFADINQDNLFDGDNSVCDKDDGCVNRYNIKRGNSLKKICYEYGSGLRNCDIVSKLNIVFRRPNPDAVITMFKDDNSSVPALISAVVVCLGGADGESERAVRVQPNGLIEILNEKDVCKTKTN